MCVCSAYQLRNHCQLGACNYYSEMQMPKDAAYSAACCKDAPPINGETLCFLPDILKEIEYLRDRHKHMVTKNPRLLRLSQPRIRNAPYREPCVCPDVVNRKVQILRLDESPVHTRTEQLAYPTMRSLSCLKRKQSYAFFSEDRKNGVNRLMRKSLHSLYSRLSNAQPPAKAEPLKKWTDKDWVEHMKRIGALAKPKAYKTKKKSKKAKDVAPHRTRKPVVTYPNSQKKSNARRVSKLARPKKYVEIPEKKWHLTPSLRDFIASTRLTKLAKPKVNYGYVHRDSDPFINPKALSYHPTERIRELASPHKIRKRVDTDIRQRPFMTKRSALRAQITPRMVKLAAPREVMDFHIRSQPYRVARRALVARITARLIELAQPRQISRPERN